MEHIFKYCSKHNTVHKFEGSAANMLFEPIVFD